MKRLIASLVLLAGLVILGQTQPVWAQQGTPKDTVDYIDAATKKEVKIVGIIKEESPAGIKIEEGKALKMVPALTITQVTYKNAKVSPLDFRAAFTKEKRAVESTKPADQKTQLKVALSEFQSLAGLLKDTPNASRYIQFKIAQVKLRLAEADPENQAQAKSALVALNDFKDNHFDGWQIVPCLKLLAELHEKQGDLDSARKAYESLVTIPDAPKDIKEEGELMIAQMLVRGKKYDEAERKLQTLYQTMPKDDPKRGLVQLYLIEARLVQGKLDQVEPALKAALAGAVDPAVKAAAHNFMGDYFRARKQDDEAFWQYLRVDALYADDKAEHAKALYHLWKLYESVKANPQRAQQCFDRLTDKAYPGPEFKRKALAEKPATPDK